MGHEPAMQAGEWTSSLLCVQNPQTGPEEPLRKRLQLFPYPPYRK